MHALAPPRTSHGLDRLSNLLIAVNIENSLELTSEARVRGIFSQGRGADRKGRAVTFLTQAFKVRLHLCPRLFRQLVAVESRGQDHNPIRYPETRLVELGQRRGFASSRGLVCNSQFRKRSDHLCHGYNSFKVRLRSPQLLVRHRNEPDHLFSVAWWRPRPYCRPVPLRQPITRTLALSVTHLSVCMSVGVWNRRRSADEEAKRQPSSCQTLPRLPQVMW